jgi:hypothetical protein
MVGVPGWLIVKRPTTNRAGGTKVKTRILTKASALLKRYAVVFAYPEARFLCKWIICNKAD